MLRGIPFLPKRHEGDDLLPTVIAVMSFLTVLTLAGAFALGRGLDAWSRGLDDRVTVQITAADKTDRENQANEVVRMLRASPDVQEVAILAKSEVLSLVSPWLGDLPADTNLPLPTLVAVTLKPEAIGDLSGLKQRLIRVAPSAILDDHQAWLGSLLNLAAFLRTVLASATVMVLLSTAAIIIFGCRAGLAAYRDTILIMHSMGAKDSTISHGFERRYLLHGVRGGVYGAIGAAFVLWGMGFVLGSLAEGLMTALFPGLPSPFWLLLFPFLMGVVALITARITVRGSLKKMV